MTISDDAWSVAPNRRCRGVQVQEHLSSLGALYFRGVMVWTEHGRKPKSEFVATFGTAAFDLAISSLCLLRGDLGAK